MRPSSRHPSVSRNGSTAFNRSSTLLVPPPSTHPPARAADVPFPKTFKATVKNIFKRLFRVYAHIYYSHFEKVRRAECREVRLRMLLIAATPCAGCGAGSGGAPEHVLQALHLLCAAIRAGGQEGAGTAGGEAHPGGVQPQQTPLGMRRS